MKLTLVFVVLSSSLLALSIAATNGNRLRFRYGDTNINFHLNIKVFDPKGLKVSIPHMDGLEMFSFHGSVNSPLFSGSQGGDRDGSNFAHDVTGSINGEWVYENKDVKLEIGDILNFWVFLQYKGAGQRFNDLSHVVKKLISKKNMDCELPSVRPTTARPPIIFTRPIEAKDPHMSVVMTEKCCEANEDNLQDVRSQLNMTLGKMRSLEQFIIPLEEKLNILTETLTELAAKMNLKTNLMVFGVPPVNESPDEDVRHIIVDILGLSDLSKSILNAKYESNGISFNVPSYIDKLRILKKSNDILSNLSYQIRDPPIPVIDFRMS